VMNEMQKMYGGEEFEYPPEEMRVFPCYKKDTKTGWKVKIKLNCFNSLRQLNGTKHCF
jgi:hypothetical protein